MQIARKAELEAAVYNIPEIAVLLDINVIKAYELAKRKDFPTVRIGRRIVVPKRAFHRWLDSQAVGE
ncbi:MAG: helix-turn-helix domain-containing protein [Firmicutes bacterium]|nr:helix-turn-helix domain-containing protein [Bacillota bacterium]